MSIAFPCGLCHYSYTATDRAPTLIPCGHTICKSCIDQTATKIDNLLNISCPFCSTTHSVEQFRANFALIELLFGSVAGKLHSVAGSVVYLPSCDHLPLSVQYRIYEILPDANGSIDACRNEDFPPLSQPEIEQRRNLLFRILTEFCSKNKFPVPSIGADQHGEPVLSWDNKVEMYVLQTVGVLGFSGETVRVDYANTQQMVEYVRAFLLKAKLLYLPDAV